MMKMLVTDFDNTLYVDEKISEENIAFIQTIQEKGHFFVIATGRSHASLIQTMEPFGLKPDCLILNNGALILDTDFSHRFLLKNAKEKAHILMRDFEIKRFQVLNGYTEQNINAMTDIDWLQGVCSFYLNFSNEIEKDAVLEFLKTWKDVEIMHEGLNIDVLASHVDKARAVHFIQDYYQLDQDDIMTIGDGYNDLGMIEKYDGVLLSRNEAQDPQSLKKLFNF